MIMAAPKFVMPPPIGPELLPFTVEAMTVSEADRQLVIPVSELRLIVLC
jgi:hypothetical protein